MNTACPHCGLSLRAWDERCRGCGAFLEAFSTDALVRPGLPWEHRGSLGWWRAGWTTARGVVLEPARTFYCMRPASWDAFLFFSVFGVGGTLAAVLLARTGLCAYGFLRGGVSLGAAWIQWYSPTFERTAGYFLAWAALVPLGILPTQLGLLLVRGRSARFGATAGAFLYTVGVLAPPSLLLALLSPLICWSFPWMQWGILAAVGIVPVLGVGYLMVGLVSGHKCSPIEALFSVSWWVTLVMYLFSSGKIL